MSSQISLRCPLEAALSLDPSFDASRVAPNETLEKDIDTVLRL